MSSLLGACVYVVYWPAWPCSFLCLTAHVGPTFITPSFLTAAQGVSAVDRALLALALVAAAVGLAFLGKTLAGKSQPAGMRAGVFLGVMGFLVVLLIVRVIGGMLESGGRIDAQAGLIVIGVLAAVLFGGLGYLFFLPSAAQNLIAFEEQGWFSATTYKRTQGMRVRRATIMGFLIIAGCGVYSLLNRNMLGSAGSQHLQVLIPFTAVYGGYTVRLLPDVAFTLPILLIAGSLWIGWRLVNYPAFADFLIATEAEMNKVSWTTRKRLVQDTLIVLTTMLLLTMFLFVVDIVWFKILSNPWVPILQTEQKTKSQELKQQEW